MAQSRDSFFLLLTFCLFLGGCTSSHLRPSVLSESVTDPPPKHRVNVRWKSSLRTPGYLSKEPQEFAGPVVIPDRDNVVVATAPGELWNLRGSNGELNWRVDLQSPIHGTPLWADDMIFVGTLDGKVVALDSDTGEEAWRHVGAASIEGHALTVAEGRLLVGDSSETLFALDAATGDKLWVYQRQVPEYFVIKGGPAPVVRDGMVYCGFGDGTLAALQLETGEEIWVQDLAGDSREFADVDLAVAVSDDGLVTASYSGGVFELESETGRVKSKIPILGVIDLVQAEQGNLYAATASGHLIGVRDGDVRWSFRFDNHHATSIAVEGPFLLAVTADGPIYIMDRSTGNPLSIWRGHAGSYAPIVRGKRRSYFMSNKGVLTAFELSF
jgi:outer membrane protein assembly factor BamB